MIFILTFFYHQFSLTDKQWRTIVKLLHCLVIINLFMIGLTYYLGPEDYMKLLTGRYQWGTDDEYKFQISAFLSRFWRSPGAIGSSAASAYFALFTYILYDKLNVNKFYKLLVIIFLFLTFTRSAYLAFLIYFFLKFLLKKDNFKKYLIALRYGAPIIIVGLIAISQMDIFSVKSLFVRFEIWFNQLNIDYNFIYGGAIGNLGAAVRGAGAKAILDSYWLMMFFSTGLIGLFIWLLFFYEKALKSKKTIIAIIGIIFSGFFITITQAIPFLVMFPMIFLNYENNTV